MSHCDTLLWCICFPLFPETNDINEGCCHSVI